MRWPPAARTTTLDAGGVPRGALYTIVGGLLPPSRGPSPLDNPKETRFRDQSLVDEQNQIGKILDSGIGPISATPQCMKLLGKMLAGVHRVDFHRTDSSEG